MSSVLANVDLLKAILVVIDNTEDESDSKAYIVKRAQQIDYCMELLEEITKVLQRAKTYVYKDLKEVKSTGH